MNSEISQDSLYMENSRLHVKTPLDMEVIYRKKGFHMTSATSMLGEHGLRAEHVEVQLVGAISVKPNRHT